MEGIYRISGLTRRGGLRYWALDVPASNRLEAITLGRCRWNAAHSEEFLSNINAVRNEDGKVTYRRWQPCDWGDTVEKFR